MLRLEKLRAVPSVDNLRKWNIWLAGLYALELVAALLIGHGRSVSVTNSFLNIDSLQSTSQGSLVLAPATKHLFNLNLLYLLGIVLALNVILYLTLATWRRSSFEADIKTGHNRSRWIGYGLTTTVLFIILAILAGLTDVASLVLVLILGLVLHGLCLLVERVATSVRNKDRGMVWLAYGMVLLSGFGMWALIALYLLGANLNGGGHIPGYVYWLAATTAFASLGYVLLLLRQTYRPLSGQGYRLVERNYLLFSFVMTSLITWQIVFGALTK